MDTVLGGMDGGQGQFQLWTGEVLDFIYSFTFIYLSIFIFIY